MTPLPPLDGSGGGVLAFQSDRDRQDEIYVMNADGSGQRLLISHTGALDAMPAWSPDGGQIAYASRERGKDFEICVIRVTEDLQPVKGAGARCLTDNDVDDLRPAWSQDGTQIAFFAERDGDTEIYIVAASGAGQRQLTDNDSNDQDPAWSPDGSQLAFISRRDGDYEIYLTEPDGGEQMALTDNDSNEWAPAWSPDGRRLAFISDRDGQRHLYVMDADGGNPRRLTDDGFPWNDEPAWSPDSSQLAFRSNVNGYVDIYLVATDGSSGLVQLTHNAEYDQDRAPAWRPAGAPDRP